jgi:hypothetical protein
MAGVTGVTVFTVITAVCETVFPVPFVTVRVYVVVSEGVMVTAVPLVTVRLPGVMTPAPPAKTAVKPADPPVATEVGFATKLVMTGAEADVELSELTQPVRLPKPRQRTMASVARTGLLFIFAFS